MHPQIAIPYRQHRPQRFIDTASTAPAPPRRSAAARPPKTRAPVPSVPGKSTIRASVGAVPTSSRIVLNPRAVSRPDVPKTPAALAQELPALPAPTDSPPRIVTPATVHARWTAFHRQHRRFPHCRRAVQNPALSLRIQHRRLLRVRRKSQFLPRKLTLSQSYFALSLMSRPIRPPPSLFPWKCHPPPIPGRFRRSPKPPPLPSITRTRRDSPAWVTTGRFPSEVFPWKRKRLTPPVKFS